MLPIFIYLAGQSSSAYKVVAHGTVCTTVCHGCIAPYKGHKLSYNTYIIRTDHQIDIV
jgi:hypothetical protein